MKYFLDTKSLEGKQSKKSKPTIDFISICIVSESYQSKPTYSDTRLKSFTYTLHPGREYYAVSKDFNLKAAWNRYEIKDTKETINRYVPVYFRDSVLKPIYRELMNMETPNMPYHTSKLFDNNYDMSYKKLKYLIKKYGKSNKQIAKEIIEFTSFGRKGEKNYKGHLETDHSSDCRIIENIEFYSYYADYDWVVFCWLFGKRINLPKSFPVYCKNIKQMLDGKYMFQKNKYENVTRLDAWLKDVKKYPNYPKQTITNNVLASAKWNKELYNFINKL